MDGFDSAAAERLNSVLNKIDVQKSDTTAVVPTNLCVTDEGSLPVVTQLENCTDEPERNKTDAGTGPSFSGWYSYFDGKSCKRYFHNHVSGVTQWEKPEVTDIVVVPPPAPLSRPTEEVPVENAYFSRTSGRFSHAGSQSYWAKVIFTTKWYR